MGISEHAAEALPTQASNLGNTYHTTRGNRLFFCTIPLGQIFTLLNPLKFNWSKANIFIVATMVEKVYVTYNQVCILEYYTRDDAENPARIRCVATSVLQPCGVVFVAQGYRIFLYCT